MPKYSESSKLKLNTCHPALQKVFNRVIEIIDCTVVEGHRPQELQDKYFKEGKSKLPWPKGEHNSVPSRAIDAAPCTNKGKLSWDQRHCLFFAGIVIGVAEGMSIKLRWGGDWDGDRECVTDQDFQDLVHFELI
jgi:peptidoglycan L-alanyl-D-glutamate endopeptidase CwlK